MTLDDGAELRAAVVVATGVSYRRMGIERLEALVGRGVFYGSGTSEAPAPSRASVVRRRRRELCRARRRSHLARHAGPRDRCSCAARSIVDTMSDYLIHEIDTAGNVDVRLNTEIAACTATSG